MFYCNECADKYGWPKSVMRWRSVCERCDRYDPDCSDVPSSALPAQPPAASQPSTKEKP